MPNFDLKKVAKVRMGVLLLIYCMFLEHLFARTPLKDYFWVTCPLVEKVLSKLQFLPSVIIPLSTIRSPVN